MSSKDHDLIIAEIHRAIIKLGGSAQPATPDEPQRALRDLGADIDLLSIVDSWQDTLPDEDILQLLRNSNAGRPLKAKAKLVDISFLPSAAVLGRLVP